MRNSRKIKDLSKQLSDLETKVETRTKYGMITAAALGAITITSGIVNSISAQKTSNSIDELAEIMIGCNCESCSPIDENEPKQPEPPVEVSDKNLLGAESEKTSSLDNFIDLMKKFDFEDGYHIQVECLREVINFFFGDEFAISFSHCEPSTIKTIEGVDYIVGENSIDFILYLPLYLPTRKLKFVFNKDGLHIKRL